MAAVTVPGVVALAKGAPVEVRDIVVPDPGPGEARVAVQACGGCHTHPHYPEGAAMYTGGVGRGDSVAVFGCGGVGDAAIAGARLAGANPIIAVDIDPKKLAWAEEFGATHTVNSSGAD